MGADDGIAIAGCAPLHKWAFRHVIWFEPREGGRGNNVLFPAGLFSPLVEAKSGVMGNKELLVVILTRFALFFGRNACHILVCGHVLITGCGAFLPGLA